MTTGAPLGTGDTRGPQLAAFTNLGPSASSQRARLFEWVRRTGVSCDISTYLGTGLSSPRQLLSGPLRLAHAEADLRRRARRRHELVLVLREASPLSRGGTEERLLRQADHGVYDFDDALQWDHGSGRAYRRLAPKALKTITSVTAADLVIAGNAVLADWASTVNPNVAVIPTCVDVDDYEQKQDYALEDPPRLGWIGSSNNETYLKAVAAPLLELNRRTGARLTLVTGAGPTGLGPLESMIDRVGWSMASQRSALRTFDVGIMPLPDAPYERGKCGYKLLQYAAAGLPSAGSPVGANEEILRATGMPAPATPADWLDALLGLLTASADSRRDMADRARDLVVSRWSYEAWQPRWTAAALGGYLIKPA